MNIVFSALLVLHALIHLAGAIKAFRPQLIPQFKQPVTRPAGTGWFLASVLFLLSGILYLIANPVWWMFAGAALLISQCMVFAGWRSAKYGTIVNVIILCVTITGCARWNFYRHYTADAETFLQQPHAPNELLTESDIQALPPPVQKYIRYTHALNTPGVSSFRVEFTGRIRDYEKKEWMDFTSVQYNFLQPPARLFFLNATMNHLPVSGYHRYNSGVAFMDIRLFSLVTVQYEEGNEMNIAETVTFFNDMCVMAPATLIDKRIHWIPVDDYRSDATFTSNGITISASLFFNADGALINFISGDRYARQSDGTMKRMTWSTPLKNYTLINGLYLASDAQAVYAYPGGDFCYGEFHLSRLEYNPAAFTESH